MKPVERRVALFPFFFSSFLARYLVLLLHTQPHRVRGVYHICAKRLRTTFTAPSILILRTLNNYQLTKHDYLSSLPKLS